MHKYLYKYCTGRNYERFTKINFLIEWHFVSVLRERDPQPLPRQPRGRIRDAAIIITNKNSTALSLKMLKNETTVQELQHPPCSRPLLAGYSAQPRLY